MMIRTIEELDKVHTPWAVVIDEHGQAWQEAGLVEGTLPGKAWICPGGILTSQQLFTQSKTLTLIYPRRYGDEDVERVVDAIRATPRCSIVYDEDGDPWCKDHDIEWFHDNARFPYGCQHQEHAWARAALNALEGK